MGKLFPKIEKPYNSGFMPVTGGHKIYYEQCGNPKGKPIIFVHGGPGVGCDARDRRFFDPKKWRIILFDQRGSRRSKPKDEIKNNTTQYLIGDMYKLLKFLQIPSASIYGRSWGTALSLIYAINFPETVNGMVLAGVFLATQEEMDYFYKDGFNGLGVFLPREWERFISHVPEKNRIDPLAYYLDEISRGNESLAQELILYESSAEYRKKPKPESIKDNFKILSIDNYYFRNNFFIPDNFILNNISSIPKNIPISIIHGRYDFICMPLSAYRLHKALPNSTFNPAFAGHSSRDPENRKMILSEIENLYPKI